MQLKETLEVMLSRGGMRAAVGWKPFSVTAFQMLRTLRALEIEPKSIVDAGANIGQFARAATETFPSATIIAFEPLPDIAEQMRSNLGDTEHVDVRTQALGRDDGTVILRRNEYSQASSVLRLRSDAARSFKLQERDTVEVPVSRLDTALQGENLERPLLIKLDLQGYELEALHGAEQTLGGTSYVLVEIALQPMYEGQPDFDDVYSFLKSAGFRFACPVALLRNDHGRVSQMDALFTSS